MKQRKWRYVIGLLLLVLSGLLFLKNHESDSKIEQSSGSVSSASAPQENKPRPAEPDEINTKNVSLGKTQNEEFRFAATELPAPPEDTDLVEEPKYRAGGSGTRGAIRDQERNLIFRATDESPAVAITISPNEKFIWVSGGDRKSYIINTKGGEVANLPIVPPGKDMLGFGKWVWLDNHRLLGDSGVQKYDATGNLITCCGGDNVSESRFYVYDLRTNEMEEMQLPENLRGKVVSFGKVLKTGELQLGHGGDEFGWYQVTDLEEKR
ncbi:MAG: hypothetical protein V4733_01195 [Verrucomicrobiota bacterium]